MTLPEKLEALKYVMLGMTIGALGMWIVMVRR